MLQQRMRRLRQIAGTRRVPCLMDGRHVWFKSVNSCNKTKSCFVSRSKTIRVRRGKAYESRKCKSSLLSKASTFTFIQRYNQCRNRNEFYFTLVVNKMTKKYFGELFFGQMRSMGTNCAFTVCTKYYVQMKLRKDCFMTFALLCPILKNPIYLYSFQIPLFSNFSL